MAGLTTMMSGMSLSAGKSFLSGSARVSTATAQAPSAISLTIEAAHKKGAGSTKNGRDSNAKRLGVKVYGEQPCKAGSIIVRQRGTKFAPGENVGVGKDHTIYSLIDGVVAFERKGKTGKKISVYPAQPRVKDPNSRASKHRAQFTPRALQAVAE